MIRRVLSAVGRRVQGRRRDSYRAAKPLVVDKAGLEVGGPSDIFAAGGPLPLYPLLRRLDNCNFGTRTVWEGEIREGETFKYARGRAAGRQFVAEAADLWQIADTAYDVVLSSHTIEHVANPIRALREWLRILKAGGGLVLVVPHHAGTFDHRRDVTTLEHLLDDEAAGTGEDDRTHLPEILALHDLALDPGAVDMPTFNARSERNVENRCLHHHVFDTALVVDMLSAAGLKVDVIERIPPYHIVAIARKP